MSIDHSYDHDDQDYGHHETPSHKRQGASRRAAASRPVAGRKRGKSPTSVNGMHKRRRRKMSW